MKRGRADKLRHFSHYARYNFSVESGILSISFDEAVYRRQAEEAIASTALPDVKTEGNTIHISGLNIEGNNSYQGTITYARNDETFLLKVFNLETPPHISILKVVR